MQNFPNLIFGMRVCQTETPPESFFKVKSSGLRSLFGLFLVLLVFGSVYGSSEPVVRVGLGKIRASLKLEFPDGANMMDSRNKVIRRFRPGQSFDWSSGSGKKPGHIGQTLRFRSDRNGRITIGKRSYRGVLAVRFSRSGAKVINEVALEDYVNGVVGKEIGSLSPPETLKAQAVIARTYAFANKNRHGKSGYDVCDSTHCQVYGGAGSERETVRLAVDQTAGMVIISGGRPIETLYHATCGGMTSDNEKVFGGKATSYLRRVVCPFCVKGINYRWKRSISFGDLQKKLRGEKISFSRVSELSIEAPAYLDRVDNVVLKTDRGVQKVRGTTFRRVFNLPSTAFIFDGIPTPPAKQKPPRRVVRSLPPGRPVSRIVSRTFVRSMGGSPDAGPAQLIVQSSSGLARVVRPDEGWKVIGVEAANVAVPLDSETIFRQESKIEAPRSGELNLLGRGYGHGVGLCQAGAIALGRRGWNYRQILAFYYSDVAIRKMKY